MAEDYLRAQAEAAALQQALAARRASVVPPSKGIIKTDAPYAMRPPIPPSTQAQYASQAQARYQPPHKVYQAGRAPQGVAATADMTQTQAHRPAAMPSPADPSAHRIAIPSEPRAPEHIRSRLVAPVVCQEATLPATLPTPTSLAASGSGSPAQLQTEPVPYRHPTMQDLPLVKPPPRQRGMTPETKNEPQYALSRGAIRDERYRERLAAGAAASGPMSGIPQGGSRVPAQVRPTSSGGYPHMNERAREAATDPRAPPSQTPATLPKAPGGLMISLDSPLLSPRTRARIIAATTGLAVPSAPREATPPQPQARRETPPPAIPPIPARAQVDMEQYHRFRAQEHGRRPSHPISPDPVRQTRLPPLAHVQAPAKRRTSFSDDLARLQHRAPVSRDQRDVGIGPLRNAAARYSPQQNGLRLAPFALRAPPSTSPQMQARERAPASHMTNAAIIATAAAAAIRTHGVRSPAAASFSHESGPQGHPASRMRDSSRPPPAEASPLRDHSGYAEWRAEQDAALAAAREAYEAELGLERQRQRAEELKQERLRQLDRLKRNQPKAEYSDPQAAMDQYRTERWEGNTRPQHVPQAGRPHPITQLQATAQHGQSALDPIDLRDDDTQRTAGLKQRTSEEEKRRRRKIQYQVFVHARATPCKWHNCHAILTSWSNLEKHIKQAHLRSGAADKAAEEDRKPVMLNGVMQIKPVEHHCEWASCSRFYADKERLYRHCLVEHMGDFCARCPFQCRYEGPDFASLMAHIERRHPHCTPADFTPAVSRAFPPRHREAPGRLPRTVLIHPEGHADGAERKATSGLTPVVRPASPKPDSRIERFVTKGITSRSPPGSYDIDSSRDRGWMDRKVAGEVINVIVKSAVKQASEAKSEQKAEKEDSGVSDSEAPRIVVEDEDSRSDTSNAYHTTDSLKTLAKDIRKRMRAEHGGTPPAANRASSPYISPRAGPAYLSPASTPRPNKRGLLDVSDIENGPNAKRTTDGAERYISPEDEVKVSTRLPRINLRLGGRNVARSTSEPTATPPTRRIALYSEFSRSPGPVATPRRPSEVESFKALFANVNVAPQRMDDITTSPDLPASGDVRDRAASHPHQPIPRRGLLELPAPAVPRPRSVSDRGVSDRHPGSGGIEAADSPLLAHVAKILSGDAKLPSDGSTLESWRKTQPALRSFWKDSSPRKADSLPSRRLSLTSDGAIDQNSRRASHAETEGASTRASKASRSGSEDPWAVESEYEEEEGMNVERVCA